MSDCAGTLPSLGFSWSSSKSSSATSTCSYIQPPPECALLGRAYGRPRYVATSDGSILGFLVPGTSLAPRKNLARPLLPKSLSKQPPYRLRPRRLRVRLVRDPSLQLGLHLRIEADADDRGDCH